MAGHKPEIIPALPEHVASIASRVRPDDARELGLLLLSPERALRISLRTALAAWTGTVDGVPVCMFGVSPGEMLEGRPWMIGTRELDQFAMIFLRRCKFQVARMLQVRPVLVNYVSADNARAIEWLTWLGFTVETPIPWGPKRAPFHRFSLTRR